MKHVILKGIGAPFFAGIVFLLVTTSCCLRSTQEPDPIVDPILIPGEEEVRDNIITIVTEKPVGSTLAFTYKVDESVNFPFEVEEGLKEGVWTEKGGRHYWVYTVTQPIIKLKGPITVLDLSTRTDADLNELEESNRIKSIVVSPTTFLKSLIYNNSHLTEKPTLEYVNVSKAPNLAYLLVPHSKLTSLDVTQNRKLYSFYCNDNQLTDLDLSQNALLNTLSVSNNPLKRIDVRHMTRLNVLECHSCELAALDLTHNRELSHIDVRWNALTTLDVRNNRNLQTLTASVNRLQTIYLGEHPHLSILELDDNQLTHLDLSGLPVLRSLYCYRNQLSKLDLSHSSKLFHVACFENKIVGKSMTQMVASLPIRGEKSKIAIVNPLAERELNSCLKSDVAIATERNWTCYQVAKTFDWDFNFYTHGAVYEGK
ncbi:leucine-rich repeat domain-containing protein [Porphyromonas circumdentaria]|uniref:Leucine-rich repeat (LRR) protein n=1 Tax=Porphyromonas circumdentaria TaxID=29524 RepID=A0A1T4LVZ0_9PORP|nr:hypothetical protein [Porphyromonas circumdentaria]MBB6275415.1 hypothetical protein [Porphyromonas circumdentaria]SJZ58668.1 Leucine-rich repeat (LRR) protein [Porphyromonas circumdentaria]